MDEHIKYFCNNKNFKVKNEKKARVENEENDLVTCGTYLKRKSNVKKWDKEDTAEFYRALCICGSDFSLMQRIFKNRTRKNIKDKFLRESKINYDKVQNALLNKINQNESTATDK